MCPVNEGSQAPGLAQWAGCDRGDQVVTDHVMAPKELRPIIRNSIIVAICPAALISCGCTPDLGLGPRFAPTKFLVHLTHLNFSWLCGLGFETPLLLMHLTWHLVARASRWCSWTREGQLCKVTVTCADGADILLPLRENKLSMTCNRLWHIPNSAWTLAESTCPVATYRRGILLSILLKPHYMPQNEHHL